MTPGWIKFRKDIFKSWDHALANENFPRQTGGVIVLDGTGYMDTCMAQEPEAPTGWAFPSFPTRHPWTDSNHCCSIRHGNNVEPAIWVRSYFKEERGMRYCIWLTQREKV